MAKEATKVAFELNADAGDFSGGTTSLPDGKLLDVGKRLKNGNGKIETSDLAEIEALSQFPALQLASTGGKKGGSA